MLAVPSSRSRPPADSSSGSRQVRQQIEEQVAQKSTELEQYLQRVRELEDMYRRLEEALEEERHARQDEEAVRRLQARWVEPDWRISRIMAAVTWRSC